MHIGTAAYRELTDAARYADMREFMEAMRMGGEGDVMRADERMPAGAVHLATLHGAKEELILTTSGTPSPFLAELPEGVAKEMAAPKPTYQQLSLF